MKKLNVLLICGSGASSGFLAANIRKEAEKRGLDCHVVARSEAELESYLQEIDFLMVGPHLKYLIPELEEKVAGTDITVILMEKSYYSLLDGSQALDHLLSKINN
ncbi:PTS sugar transporter subunit IIB [Izhakiella australiensis]|uniref:PTS sugar transporter subunit IIB n=1 Tax=Izhakiella australiensis TaxID=1926881 RepID=A0A1S8YLG0_9GAMM|nr:PTS sugar transporter subunit IIB [Izhakiella australiensis]OON39606.1 PTS sugar transporter subunit IIB [Izhakiella australiensis]